MEFNLIPQEQRPSSWSLLALRLSKKLAALLVVVTLAVGAAGAIFQMRTIWEQERFTDQAFPIQKRIVQQNEWERKLHELKERHDEDQRNRLHWPEILVCLADTKPEGAFVEKSKCAAMCCQYLVWQMKSAPRENGRTPCVASLLYVRFRPAA